MFRKMDNKAQGNMMMYMMIMLIMIFVFTSTGIGYVLGDIFGSILEPIIGFGGQYPVLTIVLAGIIVVTLSGSLTNFFTDWKKMGETQDVAKAFQKEIAKARREGNTNRLNKLMKMQPEIMKKQTESSSGMMKPMLFLIIFIWPIFIWLQHFLRNLSHYYVTVPWANQISFFSYPFNFGSAWIWLYLISSLVLGQMIRQGLKYISWSNWWKNIKSRIRPSVK